MKLKKGKFLNSEITKVICDMGHTDEITIGDAGLPTPEGVKKIDLALREGLPSFLEVLELVREEMEIEKVVLAAEIIKNNHDIYEAVMKMFENAEIELIEHEDFKRRTESSKAFIRTGECTPYANIILKSGVIF
nr:D-ribose pyranase [Dethiosulfatibacter aminovorans]